MKKNFVRKYAVCALLAAAGGAAPAPAPAADLTASYTFKPVKIGGGGWVTGFAVHPNVANVVYCRTDVGGAYKWNPATDTWTQLITSSRMPAGVLNAADADNGGAIGGGLGRVKAYSCDAVGLDPNNANVVYLACGNSAGNGFVLKSTDGAATFTQLSLGVLMGGNDDGRFYGERFAVQPGNSNLVFFGSRQQGLWKSTDGGTNWTQVPTTAVPLSTDQIGACCVAFDPGTPNRVYVSVSTKGVYKSEDAGATWTSISTTAATDMQVAGGTLYMAAGGVKKYTTGGGLVSVHTDTGIVDIAVDPANSSRVYAVNGNGFSHLYRTTNGGSTWTELGTNNSATGQAHFHSALAPWKESSDVRSWLSIGDISIDPFNSARMWFAEGMGMWRSDNIGDANNTPDFNDISNGIEEMVATDLQAAPGGHLVTTVWDRLGFHQTNPDVYPTAQLGLSNKFTLGTSVEAAPGNPSFLVVTASDIRGCCGDGCFSGYSTNGGATWTLFGSVGVRNGDAVNSPIGLKFGEAAISATSTANIVWIPRNGADAIYRSTNTGTRWTKATASGFSNSNYNFLTAKKVLASDSVTGGKFYAYSWNPGKVMVSTNSGGTFTGAAGVLPNTVWHGQLRAAPGVANDIWFCTGADHRGPTAERGLYHSTNAGASFAQMTGVEECWAIGFGKTATGATYPTLYMYGKVSGAWGLYRSTNGAAVWDKCADYPLGIFDQVTAVNGDPDVFGKVYVAFSGNSFAYGTSTQ
jgi:hypothetical protein